MSAKVYIVTTGEYSDYRVIAAYSTREGADRCVAAAMGSEVEEYDLDPFATELRDGWLMWEVRMTRNGHVTSARPVGGVPTVKWSLNFDVENRMYTSVIAKDREHAVKVATERRAQFIAMSGREWPTWERGRQFPPAWAPSE
jgi:hypothetical protein